MRESRRISLVKLRRSLGFARTARMPDGRKFGQWLTLGIMQRTSSLRGAAPRSRFYHDISRLGGNGPGRRRPFPFATIVARLGRKHTGGTMLYRTALSLFAVTLMASAAVAQTTPHAAPPDAFKFLAAKDVNALTDRPGPGAKTAYLADHENYFVEYATRTAAGNVAEVHAHWSHLIHVLDGQATLTYGGTVTNPKDTAPGQVRGDAIAGGTSITVRPGDFIQIPAGMPHMFDAIAPGTKFHYVVFNVRQ